MPAPTKPTTRSTRPAPALDADPAPRRTIERVTLGAGDNLFTGIATPEEFFRRPQHLHALCDNIAQRYRRVAPWVTYEDAYQEAALEVCNCRRKFDASKGKPFGGYAWASAHFKLTEMMQKASVPVSFDRSHAPPGESGGKIVDRVLRNISTVRLDAPAFEGEGASGTVGDGMCLDDTESAPPDAATRERRTTILAAFEAAAEGLAPVVVDLILAYLDGQTLHPDDYPPGWSLDRLARAAEKFTVILRRIMADADAATRAGGEMTAADLRTAAVFVPAKAPVTLDSTDAEIAALGSAIVDPVQFDPWGGGFLALTLPDTVLGKRTPGKRPAPRGVAPECAPLPPRGGPR